jgi:hypothetical protein
MNHVQGKPMAQVVCQVLRTTDYSQFQTLKGNRELNPVHIERLVRSFQNKHLVCPIIVNQHWQIIDGQHRFETAKRLGLHIDYIVVNDYGLEEVQILNSNINTWKAIDYLNGYCDLGYEHYLVFRDFMKQHPEFNFQSCEILLTNKTINSIRHNKTDVDGKRKLKLFVNQFFSGSFKVKDLQKAHDMAEKLKMIKPYYDGFNRSLFVKSMVTIFNNPVFNHAQLIGKLAQQPTSLQHCATVKQYHLLIEEIYNYRSREKVSLRF